jgi:SAM-dependent methyltransferase
MSSPTNLFWQLFCEVFESLPRQGPGNRASTLKALALCKELPADAAVLDLGCGTGAQTLCLAEALAGSVIAVDNHAPSIARLQSLAQARGLDRRIQTIAGDMAGLELPEESVDLIWSEGALYNIGIDKALQLCRRLLRRGGYLAFTDAVWHKENPPPEAKQLFESDYPTMGQANDIVIKIERADFSMIDHFTLPDAAWWEDFYTPMENQIKELRKKYKGHDEALTALDTLAQEPQQHRKYSSYYGYEFFVVRFLG